MAKRENKVLNISKIVGGPIAEIPYTNDKAKQEKWLKDFRSFLKTNFRNVNSDETEEKLLAELVSPLWTGFVKSSKINQYLIPDNNKRHEFQSLIIEYEIAILKYIENSIKRAKIQSSLKNNSKVSSSNVNINDIIRLGEEQKRINSIILSLSMKIKNIINNPRNGIDMDMFWVMLCKDYEEILSKNPTTFKSLGKTDEGILKEFYNSINNRNILHREVYNTEDNVYVIANVPTEEQKRKLMKKNKNTENLLALISGILGKDVVEKDEGMEILENICEPLYLADFYLIYNDREYGEMAYNCLCRNYLLKVGFNPDEINKMSIEELKESLHQTYDTTGSKHHKVLVARSIKLGLEFIDFEKMLLTIIIRDLMNFELAKIRLNNNPEKLISGNITSDDNIKEETIGNTEEKGNLSVVDGKIHRRFDIQKLSEKMKRVERLIKEIFRLNLISPTTKSIIVGEDGTIKEYSKKDIEIMMENFCDGIYLTETMKSLYKYRLFVEEEDISTWSEEFIQRINFDNNDITVLSLINFNNLKTLYKNGKMDVYNLISILNIIKNGSLEEIIFKLNENFGMEEQIQKMRENSEVFLEYLINEKIINASDLKLFYDKGILSLEDLEKMEKEKNETEQIQFRKQLSNQIKNEDFLKVYREYMDAKIRYEKAVKENDSNVSNYKIEMEAKRREKDAQLMLFNKYKLAELSEEDRKNFIYDLLLTYCLEITDDEQIVPETLRQMYKDGFVKFEDISNLDQTYLQTVIIDLMFVRGELSLEDTKKLRETLSLEALTGILNKAMVNPSITQSQKVSLIMNIFHNGIEDEKIADKFLSQLHAEHYVGVKYTDLIVEKGTKNEGRDIDTYTVPTYSSKEWVYPKYVKWEFLSALDKDAIITVYANGYVEAYSRKLGIRIIEKYFDVDKHGNQFGRDAYGCSTYIIKESKYIENYDRLIDSSSDDGELLLNSKTLTAIVPREDRVRHNTQSQSKNWMRTMAKYFDIDLESDIDLINDSRYTKEELEHIRSIIITYENKYIER